MIADQLDAVTSRQIASASLRTFMRLPVAQRSSVILMDVLGCSLQEVCEVMDFSLPAVKAALHRGRTQLRELRRTSRTMRRVRNCRTPIATRLGAYVAHFNARDFDAIRAMIADDVRLELVNKTRLNGKAEVSRYFGNYSQGRPTGIWCRDWSKAVPRSWCSIPSSRDAGPKYFMLLRLVGRQGRDHPRFPPRALCHRGRANIQI